MGAVALWLAAGTAALAGGPPVVTVGGLVPDEPSVPAAAPADFPPPAGMPQPMPSSRPPLLGSLTSIEGKPPALPNTRLLQPLPPPAAAPEPPPPLPALPTVTVADPRAAVVPPPPPVAESAPAVLTEPVAAAPDAGLGRRVFGSVDYLLFWIRRGPTPPLVQTIPPALANFETMMGDLPPGATTDVFPNRIDYGTFSGVRGQLGVWLTRDGCWGVDGSYMQLFRRSQDFSIQSNGVPVIGRDFVDVGDGRDSFLRYTTPDGTSRGFIDISAPSELYTADLNLRGQGPSVFSDRLDWITGFRYLNLRESLTIDSGVTLLDPTGGPPLTISSHEAFRATNQFYGSQVGIESHYSFRRLTLDVTGKVALGWVHQEVRIEGSAQSQVQGQPAQNFPNESILFVQPTNAGSHSRDHFAAVPELILKLGYQITPHVRATVGYDLLTVTSVERPGAAIDPGVNPVQTRFIDVRQPSTLPRPAFDFHGTDFWAQGVMLGLEMTY
jgi:hypothetical protein